ncbi:hypothetical protein AVEN_128828-1, partial [Araneus ventricosus]
EDNVMFQRFLELTGHRQSDPILELAHLIPQPFSRTRKLHQEVPVTPSISPIEDADRCDRLNDQGLMEGERRTVNIKRLTEGCWMD